jgi:hypothetical protein
VFDFNRLDRLLDCKQTLGSPSHINHLGAAYGDNEGDPINGVPGLKSCRSTDGGGGMHRATARNTIPRINRKRAYTPFENLFIFNPDVTPSGVTSLPEIESPFAES